MTNQNTKHEEAIYKINPYIIIGPEGNVLASGTFEEMRKLMDDSYYSRCRMEVRKHDLYLNDNTKVSNDEMKKIKKETEMKNKITKKQAKLQRTYVGFNVEVNDALLSFVIINEGAYAGQYAVNFDTLKIEKLR